MEKICNSNYEIEEEEGIIGEGSYGIVYKAKKLDTGQFVALKYISNSKIAHNQKQLGVLRLECEIHSRLNHNNIVKMIDYYETEKGLVLITELAKCSLADLIRSAESFNYDQVQKIACEIASALFYLHSERILHRDLKPENVLIGNDNVAKVCDFGLAKDMALDTFLLTSFKGTLSYMAPEILAYVPYDHKADLWSFGCILYELIMGVPPFSVTQIIQFAMMLKKPFEWDKRITGDCLSFLQGLLEINPARRLSWPELLDHPYVSEGLCVNRTVSEFALTKHLSPSQELVRGNQLLEKIQRIPNNRIGCKFRLPFQQPGLQNGLPKFQGKVKEMYQYMHTPSPNLALFQHGKMIKPLNTSTPSHHNKTEDGVHAEENNVLNDEIENNRAAENQNHRVVSSNCSVDTLTSSSGEESEDEKATIVEDSSRFSVNSSLDSRKQNSESSRPAVDPWIFGTRLAFSRPKQDDPFEIEEEWLAYLNKNIKETIRNPETLCEKYSFHLIVQPLRNQYTGVAVVSKIAFLLSLPFASENKKDASLIRNLESLYLESKVVANLVYASKLVVIRRKLEAGSVGANDNEIIEVLTVDDIEAMDKCLRLVCYLIHLEEQFVVQFCDSIIGFAAYILFKLFLKLDHKCRRLTSNTLAILCHLMRTFPENVSILEDIFFGEGEEELWSLISHKTSTIQSTALRILVYLVLHSSKAKERFIVTNSDKLWRILRNASTQRDSTVVAAAEFAGDTIRYLSSPKAPAMKPIHQQSLPLNF